jgi:hypothetical protein
VNATTELEDPEPMVARDELSQCEIDRLSLGPDAGEAERLGHQVVVDFHVGAHAGSIHPIQELFTQTCV